MSFNQLIQNESLRGMSRLTKSVKGLESNQAYPIKTGFGTVSNPPTTGEIESVFDIASNVGQDFVGFIIDTTNGYEFLVWTDGINWYVISQANGTTFSGARIEKTGNQSIPSATTTALTWNTEIFDTDSYHDNAVNNSRITIPFDGYYSLSSSICFDFSTTGVRSISIIKNATFTEIISTSNQNAVNAGFTCMMTAGIDLLSAGDYLEVYVTQTSGGNLNVRGLQYSHFSVHKIG